MLPVVERTLVGMPALPQPIAAGTTLGPYGIIAHLARGGMANVWVARHHGARGFSKLVALKTILPEFAEDQGFQRMFFEEARLAALIRHPHVCEIFEFTELNGSLSLSMEWVDGDSLSNMLARDPRPLDRRVASRIIAQAAAGLHAAHELRDDSGRALNLVHRDVSPQNILISRDGHVKLSDFGIAKVLHSQRENTAVGIVRGKLTYMSPEQARSGRLDRRSDIFSLGVVLYLATLAARPFFNSRESKQVGLTRLLRGEYARPHQVDPAFPRALEAIIERALQRDADLRYATAAEFRRDLEEWLVTSGPLITENDVARVLEDRCGNDVARRQELLRGPDARRHVPETERTVVITAGSGPAGAVPAVERTGASVSTAVDLPARRVSSELKHHRHAIVYSLMILTSLCAIAFRFAYPARGEAVAERPPAGVSEALPAPSLFRPLPPAETAAHAHAEEHVAAAGTQPARPVESLESAPPELPRRAPIAVSTATSKDRPATKVRAGRAPTANAKRPASASKPPRLGGPLERNL
jgi:serine/threonine protein kinase